MTDRHDLIAYLATLATLVIVFVAALVAASLSNVITTKMEAFGLGTLVGGLIGILRIPSAARPLATTREGDVTVETKP